MNTPTRRRVSIAESHPDICAQLTDSSYSTLTHASNKKPEWRCELGHLWVDSVAHRTSGRGCPICSHRRLVVGVNDMATTHPNIAAQLSDRSLAVTLMAGSGRKVKWRCEYGHSWESTCDNRLKGKGCPYCSGLKAVEGLSDIATLNPELAAELLHQEQSFRIRPGSDAKHDWRCKTGHVWSASVSSRASGAGCPYCSGRKVITGETDIKTVAPTLASELIDQSLATMLSVASNKKVGWRCSFGHEWTTSPNSRSRRGSGCPTCSNNVVLPGFNDIATTHPELAAQLSNANTGSLVSAGSGIRCEWICGAGHVWLAAPYTRIAGHGCPSCNNTGYRQNERDARLYLVLPTGKHPIGFGKVHNEQQYDKAMKNAYRGCLQIAYAVGDGRSVSDAELELKQIPDRPRGNIPRLITESLPRSHDSILAWDSVARKHGLKIVWLRDPESIDFPPIESSRLHAEREYCGCSLNGLNRHDSMSSCCLDSRSEASDLIKANHYLGSSPPATIHCFTWRAGGQVVAIMTLGTGSSPRNGSSLSTHSGIRALEITRLWASDGLPITLSSFVSKCLKSIRYPLFVFSYADSAQDHTGGIYRACSFNYAGWSDMTRRKQIRRGKRGTPFRDWEVVSAKHRYWKLIGLTGAKRSEALDACGWNSYDHRLLGFAPTVGHRRISQSDLEKYLKKQHELKTDV